MSEQKMPDGVVPINVQVAELLPTDVVTSLLAGGWTARLAWSHPDHPGAFNGAAAILAHDPELAKRYVAAPSAPSSSKEGGGDAP